MDILFPALVWFAWTPGFNNVAYETHVVPPGIVYESTEPKVAIHVPLFYEPVAITVVGIDAEGNRSAPSGTLWVEWRWNTDIDNDGTTSYPEVLKGYGRFVDAFGKCNDGKKEVPCL
jgi:hypothetical protein